MSYGALLLDLDDTLIDTRQGTRLALWDFHGSHGDRVGFPRDQVEAVWDRNIKTHYPKYLRGEMALQEACLMVGDNYEVDCHGALGAGMPALWIDRFGTGSGPHDADGVGAISGLREIGPGIKTP